MAQFKSPFDLMIPGLVWHWDYRRDKFVCCLHYRDIYLWDEIFHHDGIEFRRVMKFIEQLRKDVDYYLNALWC
jgi:hypothetical protein